MKYGYFNDQEKEYIIKTPNTPYPWINYLGTKDFFSLISNTAGGYSFYRDASNLRITRYRYNNVPLDTGGKYYYIFEQGEYWNPGWSPTKAKLDFYQCHHGLGYTRIRGERQGILADITYFVPENDNCEIHWVKISNLSNYQRELKLFSLVEFCLWDAEDDMSNFQRNFNTAEVEVEGSTIFHKTEYRERRNHYAFFHVNQDIIGFDTDRESFLGLYNGYHEPQTVERGQSLNSLASGWSPIASHCLSIELEPGECKTLIFQLGYVENKVDKKWEKEGIINKEKANQMMGKYRRDDQIKQALASLKEYWDNLLDAFQLKSGEDKLDRMVNIWNQYQCMVTFNLARSASYFESGISRGIGFRDSNQDLLGIVHMIPERARERILDLAATQFEDGSAYHQYQPLTKKGNDRIGSGFNDDPLWLIFGTVAYLKETGDFDILAETVPFNSGKPVSLFDHLKASFFYTINNLGPHELPLIGHADWNDCLNLSCFSEQPGESFQTSSHRQDSTAESILIAGIFITIIPDFISLCLLRGEDLLAKEVNQQLVQMREAINKYGRDEDWFIRAYDYFGNKVGSKKNQEGQIYIEPQGFCVMGGIGLDDGFARKALNSVKDRLDTDYGLVLLDPSYQGYHLELGEISSYPPGYKENGGVFCHNNPWIMIAETMIGRGEQAFEYYKKIAPAYLEEISGLHRTEPYAYAQMIAGREAANYGEAKNSWLTGTAAWNLVAITQWILGIRPEFSGLRIDPCIPAYWKQLQIVRRYRGDVYQIELNNPAGVSRGVREIRLDGRLIEGKIIKPQLDSQIHQVKVIMG